MDGPCQVAVVGAERVRGCSIVAQLRGVIVWAIRRKGENIEPEKAQGRAALASFVREFRGVLGRTMAQRCDFDDARRGRCR